MMSQRLRVRVNAQNVKNLAFNTGSVGVLCIGRRCCSGLIVQIRECDWTTKNTKTLLHEPRVSKMFFFYYNFQKRRAFTAINNTQNDF